MSSPTGIAGSTDTAGSTDIAGSTDTANGVATGCDRGLLGDPALAPLWQAVRRRVEANGLSLGGTPVVLQGLTLQQADAIAGLLGVRRPADGTLRVRLEVLDQVLRTSVVSRGLLQVLGSPEVLGSGAAPLVDRRADRARRSGETARLWAALAEHRAVAGEPRLLGWLRKVRTTGLARRLAPGSEEQTMVMVLDTLAAIGVGDAGAAGAGAAGAGAAGAGAGTVGAGTGLRRVAVVAAELTGDAHGLDRGRPAATLVVHALAWLSEQPFPADAAGWRRIWSEAGVACDDLSCDVLVLNLPGWPMEPLRLTLRQVSAWQAPPRSGHDDPPVFVCENPAVVAAAADHLGEQAPGMVCLDGMPSTAALVVLEALSGTDRVVAYHGDFDWSGLTIATVLARKVPVARPWRFTTADYCGAVGAGFGTVPLTGRATESPWDEDLAPAMAEAGVAVYEEQVLAGLLDDLAGSWQAW